MPTILNRRKENGKSFVLSMKILYVLHADFETPGAIESWAAEKRFDQEYISPFKGEVLPARGSFDCLIVMGGPQSPLAIDRFPYLENEIALIRDAIKAGLPVLGFCLGAQLIGEALGTATMQSPSKEVGVFPIALSEQGRNDPLLTGLPQEFLVAHWHNDMPGLTKDAIVLAKSAGCPRQIIRYAPHVYGFQCHAEMTLQIADLLIENCEEDLVPGASPYVQPPQTILGNDFNAINQNMYRILDNFLSILTKKYVFKPYNRIYPELFLREKERIADHIDCTLVIEHVGSTAVPGLGGKGIIDVAIAAKKENFSAISQQLQKIGYEFRPAWSTADRLYFKAELPDPEEKTRRYHLHLMPHENKEWTEMLVFRDYLRRHPEAVKEYAEVKRRAVVEADNEGAKYRKLKEHIFKKFIAAAGEEAPLPPPLGL